jgi:hypothetical protein
LSGPGGWIILAGAITATAAATYALHSEYDAAGKAVAETSESLGNNTKAQETAAAATKQTSGAFNAATVAVKSYKSAIDSMSQAYESTVFPAAVRLQHELQQMSTDFHAAAEAGQLMGFTADKLENLKLAKILDASGWRSSFDTVKDDLRILRGEITETELQFEKMSSMGVSDKRIEILREAYAERDRLTKEAGEKEQAIRDAAEDDKKKREGFVDTRNKVLDSLTSPAEKAFAEYVSKAEEVQAAIEGGYLDPTQGLTYLEAEREKLLANPTGEPPKPVQKQASNVGIDAKSQQANTMLVNLANRRGVTPDQSDAKKRTQLAVETNRVLTDIRNEARRRAGIETRPFTSRG